LSYAVAGRRRADYGNTIAAAALVAGTDYVTFEIRRLYHGPIPSSGRHYVPSNTLFSTVGLSSVVVLLGSAFRQLETRAVASAVVIALTISAS